MQNPQPQTKVCVIGASLATDNMGVNALAMGTFRCILHTFPDAEISLFDYSRQPMLYDAKIEQRDLLLPLVNIRFSKKPWQHNHIAYLLGLAVLGKIIPSGRFRKKVLLGNAWTQHLMESDVVAAISGGDSFSDIYGFMRLLYMSLPMILVLLLGKDLVLLPQTLGPFNGAISKSVARFILSRAKVVYSRDLDGARHIETQLGLKRSERIRFSYDVGFALEPRPPRDLTQIAALLQREPGVPLIGVNLSGLLYIGGYSQKNMFGLRIDYPHFVKEQIRFLIEECNAVVLLVPHVYGEAPGSESDVLASRELYQKLSGRYGAALRLSAGRYSESEVKFIIGQCDFFTGSRMHACIAAVSQCVPAVPVAYSDKFIGVMRTVGIEALVADARTMNEPEILKMIGEAIERRASIRNSLENTMPAVKKSVLGVFDDLRQRQGDSRAIGTERGRA
jgi:colanic acid/amylovoran biosynthesis protein